MAGPICRFWGKSRSVQTADSPLPVDLTTRLANGQVRFVPTLRRFESTEASCPRSPCSKLFRISSQIVSPCGEVLAVLSVRSLPLHTSSGPGLRYTPPK